MGIKEWFSQCLSRDSMVSPKTVSLTQQSRQSSVVVWGLVIVCGLFLYVFYLFYRFLQRDRQRWIALEHELLQQRKSIEQMSLHIDQFKQDYQSQQQIHTFQDQELGQWLNTMKNMSFDSSSLPIISKESDTGRQHTPFGVTITTTGVAPIPKILSENEMDTVLTEELAELDSYHYDDHDNRNDHDDNFTLDQKSVNIIASRPSHTQRVVIGGHEYNDGGVDHEDDHDIVDGDIDMKSDNIENNATDDHETTYATSLQRKQHVYTKRDHTYTQHTGVETNTRQENQ